MTGCSLGVLLDVPSSVRPVLVAVTALPAVAKAELSTVGPVLDGVVRSSLEPSCAPRYMPERSIARRWSSVASCSGVGGGACGRVKKSTGRPSFPRATRWRFRSPCWSRLLIWREITEALRRWSCIRSPWRTTPSAWIQARSMASGGSIASVARCVVRSSCVTNDSPFPTAYA